MSRLLASVTLLRGPTQKSRKWDRGKTIGSSKFQLVADRRCRQSVSIKLKGNCTFCTVLSCYVVLYTDLSFTSFNYVTWWLIVKLTTYTMESSMRLTDDGVDHFPNPGPSRACTRPLEKAARWCSSVADSCACTIRALWTPSSYVIRCHGYNWWTCSAQPRNVLRALGDVSDDSLLKFVTPRQDIAPIKRYFGLASYFLRPWPLSASAFSTLSQKVELRGQISRSRAAFPPHACRGEVLRPLQSAMHVRQTPQCTSCCRHASWHNLSVREIIFWVLITRVNYDYSLWRVYTCKSVRLLSHKAELRF